MSVGYRRNKALSNLMEDLAAMSVGFRYMIETLNQMANAIGNCGADFEMIRGKIQSAVQGSGGERIPGVMEDVNTITSAISTAREKAEALAGKLRGKADQIRAIVGG